MKHSKNPSCLKWALVNRILIIDDDAELCALVARFLGGEGYAELQSNALAYVQATEVGGTHPALVEAMGRGACVIANDVPEHREVLGEAGLYYARNDPDDLARLMALVVGDDHERERLGSAAAARAEHSFSWDHVTDEYERLFKQLAGPRPR